MSEKLCRKCNMVKPLDEFYVSKGRPDSRTTHCKRCMIEDAARWNREHSEHRRTKAKEYLERNREQVYAKNKVYRDAHPEVDIAAKARRRAAIDAGDLTSEGVREIWERDKGCCVYCGKPVKPHLGPRSLRGFDHIVPLAKGGRHTKSNLVVCCQLCNTRKHARESYDNASRNDTDAST